MSTWLQTMVDISLQIRHGWMLLRREVEMEFNWTDLSGST